MGVWLMSAREHLFIPEVREGRLGRERKGGTERREGEGRGGIEGVRGDKQDW